MIFRQLNAHRKQSKSSLLSCVHDEIATVVATVLDSITRTSDLRKDYGRVELFS